MVKNTKDLIGKWFSNVGGVPDVYFYVFSAKRHIEKYSRVYFIVSYISVDKKKVSVREKVSFTSINIFSDPLTTRRTPELQYQIHKCIRFLFEKEIGR